MSARFQRPNRVMSVRERERCRNEIASLERRMKGQITVASNRRSGDDVPTRQLGRYNQFLSDHIKEDQALLQKKKRQLEKALREGSPDSLSKSAKAAKEKQVEEDKAWLMRKMVPRSHYYVQSNHPDFKKVVQACHKEHEPEFLQRANRFKNNMRELDPDNPDASNLENIRPE